MEIMVVDDERIILVGLKSCIEAIPDIECNVRTATSGRQALELLEAAPADMLITDVEMPTMSGLELIEKAQQRGLCKRFMVLSGYDKFEYARTAIRFGVQDYLLKPFDREDLNRNLRNVAAELGQTGELEKLLPYRERYPHISQPEAPYALRKSLQYMKENYNKDISLSMLAEHAGKSENYLCNLFKREWDVTFLELINELRLREALYLLLYEPSLPIRDVAGKIGYKTERQLFRLIKSKLGLTPQQVRSGEAGEPQPAE